MLKASIALGLLALLLLIVSFAPWPAAATRGTVAQPSAPASQAEAEAQGRALFLAKGCVTCHRHDGAGTETGLVGVGPDLTHYQPDEPFVREWLRDPQAIRPTTMMPNLALEEDEIEALIAFLAAP